MVVVQSEHYGLKPLLRIGTDVQEAFIYQQTLHHNQLSKLSVLLQEQLAANGTPVEEITIRKALDDAFAKQLGATLERLPKYLPVYKVSINEQGEMEVQ